MPASGARPAERCSRQSGYAEDVEVAVYYCRLEAIENVVKHAGPDAITIVNLSQDAQRRRFEVHDYRIGFDPALRSGNGLVNMLDRVAAVGGTLNVSAHRGRGTLVRGSVAIP